MISKGRSIFTVWVIYAQSTFKLCFRAVEVAEKKWKNRVIFSHANSDNLHKFHVACLVYIENSKTAHQIVSQLYPTTFLPIYKVLILQNW